MPSRRCYARSFGCGQRPRCVPVVFDYNWRPTGAHADDEMVVETAINGHADAVATFNLKDMRKAGARFGFQAQRPGRLVKRIRP